MSAETVLATWHTDLVWGLRSDGTLLSDDGRMLLEGISPNDRGDSIAVYADRVVAY